MKYQSPSFREALWCVTGLAIWLMVTILFIGFRPEHLVMAAGIAALYFALPATRRLIVALLPFFIFGISYDWMNLLPNYEVNPVDIEGIYHTEKTLFGISAPDGSILTPNEFFAIHRSDVMDFMSGIFYLCWVPLPIFFGLWLYFSGKTEMYLRFALVFLLVNLLGFAGYYIHPAAPPWYVARYGFEMIKGTPGDVAGLGAFDALTGLGIFDSLYARNANVFAAMPSLHSAYTLVAFLYALKARSSAVWKTILGVVTLGIWATAVYTSHHYLLDVLGGIGVTLLGYCLMEYVLMRIEAFRRWLDRYSNYVEVKKRAV